MKTLHWHTDDNPCLLCGVPVTPETWQGGVIVSDAGIWSVSPNGKLGVRCKSDGRCSICDEMPGNHFDPIFPPRGWAGKTDAELWVEIVGWWDEDEGIQATWDIGGNYQCGNDPFYVALNDNAGLNFEEPFAHSAEEIAPHILALQNAQVLATRLKEAQHV